MVVHAGIAGRGSSAPCIGVVLPPKPAGLQDGGDALPSASRCNALMDCDASRRNVLGSSMR